MKEKYSIHSKFLSKITFQGRTWRFKHPLEILIKYFPNRKEYQYEGEYTTLARRSAIAHTEKEIIRELKISFVVDYDVIAMENDDKLHWSAIALKKLILESLESVEDKNK